MINQAADRLWETGEYTDEKEAKAVARMQINESSSILWRPFPNCFPPSGEYVCLVFEKVTEQKKISGIRITLRNLKTVSCLLKI